MTPDQPSTVPAGWYPDPHGVAELRWWDGSTWTEHVHTSAPLSSGETDPDRLVDASGAAVYDLDYAPDAEAPAATQPQAAQAEVAQAETAQSESPETPTEHQEPVPAEPAPTDAPLPSRRELRERERLSEAAATAAAAAAGAVSQTTPVASTSAAPTPTVPTPDPAASRTPEPDLPAEAAPSEETAPPAESPSWLPPGLAEAAPAAVAATTAAPAATSAPAAEPAVLDSATPSSFDWSPGSPSTNSVPAAEPLPAGSAWASEGTNIGAFADGPPMPDRSGTASGWIIAFMPLVAAVLSIGAIKGAENYPEFVPGGVEWWMLAGGVLAVLYLVTLLLAIADHRRLDSLGHLYPAHWAWSLLTAPVYLLVRTIAVKRETGRMSPLLWVWILLTALLVGGWFATQALAPELMAPYELPFL